MRKNLFEKIDSSRALELLKEGNKRYVDGKTAREPSTLSQERVELAQKGQFPFAVVFGCSDSRVPPEIIFDVGIGQIFVVRTGGNTADTIAVGSVECAVELFHARLIVVLAHTDCGAVNVAISGADFGPNMGAILNEIKPFIKSSDCLRENAENTAAKLAKSAILAKRIDEGVLKIVCAKYDLETGIVTYY
ncbi:MAG: carbonic anhydrase [Oscillospiraceae bacterium]|nr:carbonic anhydrase [Oscillospiraceae bacterium]